MSGTAIKNNNGGDVQSPKHGGLNALAITIMAIVVAAALLGLSFRVVMIPKVTELLAERTVNTELSAVSHDELVDVAAQGRDFVDCEPGATMPEGTDERTGFTADVVSHMEDVRSVIKIAAMVTFALCVFIVLGGVLIWRFLGRRVLGKALLIGGISAFVLVLALAIIGLANFDALFTAMHQLLFADGTWTFSEDSLLITAYPIDFWIGMAVVWAVALGLLCLLSVLIGGLMMRRGEKGESDKDERDKGEVEPA